MADRYPIRLKSSMTQEAYIDYIRSYYQISDELLTRWFSVQEEEKGREFWTDIGGGYGWASGQIGQERDYHELSADIATKFFRKPLSETNDPLLFQWVAWNTGKRLMFIKEKQSRQESLTAQDQAFLEDPQIAQLMDKVLYETIHFLVMPYEDFTIESPEGYDNLPESILAEAQKKMHEARIAAFATFPIDPKQEVSSQIRQQMGLKPLPFEKPQ